MPATPFELVSLETCKVPPDHHVPVALDKSYYSVPYTLVGEKVTVRVTATTVEIFYREERVASHIRQHDPKEPYRTQPAHRPPNHTGYLEQSTQQYLDRAARIGPGVVLFFEGLFQLRKYPPLAYRTCQGILTLQRSYAAERIDAACAMALNLRSLSWRTVEGILKHGSDRSGGSRTDGVSFGSHENVRGAAAFLPENGPADPENRASPVHINKEQEGQEDDRKADKKAGNGEEKGDASSSPNTESGQRTCSVHSNE